MSFEKGNKAGRPRPCLREMEHEPASSATGTPPPPGHADLDGVRSAEPADKTPAARPLTVREIRERLEQLRADLESGRIAPEVGKEIRATLATSLRAARLEEQTTRAERILKRVRLLSADEAERLDGWRAEEAAAVQDRQAVQRAEDRAELAAGGTGP